MFYNVYLNTGGLSSFANYKKKSTDETKNKSIIDFKPKNNKGTSDKTDDIALYALASVREDYQKAVTNPFDDDKSSFEDSEASNTKVEKYDNGAIKKTTNYDDGSYDEIYENKDGISYMRIKRYEGEDNYIEIYRDSTGFCGRETCVKLADGTTISANEFSNGKKYTETYKKNPDGGFTRKLENNDGTGYIESQAYNSDGTSSYSIENFDGSGNTIIYNPDGSYKEILIDSNGNKTETEFNK